MVCVYFFDIFVILMNVDLVVFCIFVILLGWFYVFLYYLIVLLYILFDCLNLIELGDWVFFFMFIKVYLFNKIDIVYLYMYNF